MKSGNYLVIQTNNEVFRDVDNLMSYILGKDLYDDSKDSGKFLRDIAGELGRQSETYNREMSSSVESLINYFLTENETRVPNYSSAYAFAWERPGWKRDKNSFVLKSTGDKESDALLGVGIYFGTNKLTEEQINYIGTRAVEFFNLNEEFIYQTDAKVASYSFVEVKLTQTVHSFKDC